jgi:hypothetical protein
VYAKKVLLKNMLYFGRYKKDKFLRRDLVHMGTSASFTFRILEISKSYISMSLKIMALKYIGKYLPEEYMQKSSV